MKSVSATIGAKLRYGSLCAAASLEPAAALLADEQRAAARDRLRQLQIHRLQQIARLEHHDRRGIRACSRHQANIHGADARSRPDGVYDFYHLWQCPNQSAHFLDFGLPDFQILRGRIARAGRCEGHIARAGSCREQSPLFRKSQARSRRSVELGKIQIERLICQRRVALCSAANCRILPSENAYARLPGAVAKARDHSRLISIVAMTRLNAN